jgi:L-glutamine-phosphate cytidylyltransferase
MKALILAAGRGTRIQSVHGDHPKCLIRFNGSKSTILDHQIDSLLSIGVANIGIVVGYEKDQIIRHVIRNYGDEQERFRFIENSAFATTNNIYSFWLAQTWLNREPFVCLNADVVFDSRILIPAIQSLAPITMVVDPKWRDETMKVVISQDRVIRMSKRILQSEFSGTYIGVTAFAANVQQELFAKVETLIRSGKQNEFFNVAVQQLADEGVRVGFTSTGDLPWAEIDDPGDLAFARLHVFPKLSSRPIAA